MTLTLDTSARCDRCGAQAYFRFAMPSGLTLDFCAHHHKAHEQKLLALKDKIKVLADTRELLTAGK